MFSGGVPILFVSDLHGIFRELDGSDKLTYAQKCILVIQRWTPV